MNRKMNFIEWLELGKNIRLGRLRADIKKDDIVIVKGLSPTNSRFGERLHKIFPNNLIILLPPEAILEKLNEIEMNRFGWVRK